jgi:hypothetical protein
MKLMSPKIKSGIIAISVASFTLLLAACSPEVGSAEWCEDMKGKDKGQWTAEEATAFAKSCLL